MRHNLEGRVFRSVSNTSNGEVGDETLFRYRQDGNTVRADYSGGAVAEGHLLGVMRDDGSLEFLYHHINTEGRLMAGKCASMPELLADGRLRLREQWQWMTGDRSSGASVIEEVAPTPRQ